MDERHKARRPGRYLTAVYRYNEFTQEERNRVTFWAKAILANQDMKDFLDPMGTRVDAVQELEQSCIADLAAAVGLIKSVCTRTRNVIAFREITLYIDIYKRRVGRAQEEVRRKEAEKAKMEKREQKELDRLEAQKVRVQGKTFQHDLTSPVIDLTMSDSEEEYTWEDEDLDLNTEWNFGTEIIEID